MLVVPSGGVSTKTSPASGTAARPTTSTSAKNPIVRTSSPSTRTIDVLKTKVVPTLGTDRLQGDTRICKVSIVGIGMRSHAGVAATMFTVLAERNINIQAISTSEIKVSVMIDEDGVWDGLTKVLGPGVDGELVYDREQGIQPVSDFEIGIRQEPAR